MSDEYGGEMEIATTVHWRDQFGRFMADIDAAGATATKGAAAKGAYLAAVFAPKRKLTLAASITPFYISSTQAGWTAGSGHALPQEHGARAHDIGSPGQKLGSRETGFFAIGPVHHPGNPATHFMKRAYDIVKGDLLGAMKRSLSV